MEKYLNFLILKINKIIKKYTHINIQIKKIGDHYLKDFVTIGNVS